ncbi:hypothetical protein ACHAXT_000520 [Thalassiosira profunda]
MSSLALPMVMLVSIAGTGDLLPVGAFKILSCPPASRPRQTIDLSPTALHAQEKRWWEGGGGSDGVMSKFFPDQSNEPGGMQNQQQQLITREMEQEVMASARASVDGKTVSRAISSLIEDERNNGSNGMKQYNSDQGSSLRDLASATKQNGNQAKSDTSESGGSSSWDTQQIAVASGATTFLLSPIIVPIVHSLLPPIIPSPASLSVTGAALLGSLSYIVALGDPTDQSDIIAGKTGGALGDGVEVGGAVSRIVGRTALSVSESSAPRLKAAARAMVDYESTTATIEELQTARRQLAQTVLDLEAENDSLREEVALWQAVEDITGMYKLEELKEMARYKGIKGYSTDSKNALLRKLVREGVLELDLTPYY